MSSTTRRSCSTSQRFRLRSRRRCSRARAWPAGRRTSSSRSARDGSSVRRRATLGRRRDPLPTVLTLAEAAARADALAAEGNEQELADLRREWEDELEADARSSDYRQRAVAYRAVGQFRFRQKMELLRRGLEDESPACRGSALISLELLSRDDPAASTPPAPCCTGSCPRRQPGGAAARGRLSAQRLPAAATRSCC